MKTTVAILLLTTTGLAIAETGSDQPVTVYKAGKPYIYDSLRRMAPPCPTRDAPQNCQAPSKTTKPEAEKKPVPKGVG